MAALAIQCLLPYRHACSADENAALVAGVVRVDVTPTQPVMLAGYAARNELSAGVHDRLYARVVAFEQGDQRLVLVSVDFIGFYRTYEPMRDAICERFGLQPSEIFLCGTHTHSGPTPTLQDDVHPHNLQYTRTLQEKLVAAVEQALAQTNPVHLGVGRGHSPVGANRRERQPDGSIRLGRNPYGPTDKEVLVMKLAKPDGAPIAALFDYATHATSLGPGNLHISGDVLGIAEQFVEQTLAPDVIAPAFAGASGDIDPWYRVLPSFNTENGRVPEPVLLGTLLGEEVVHVFRKTDAAVAPAGIATEFATLELPASLRPGRDDSQTEADTRPLNVTVARIGNVGFVGLGCELLTEVGMAIKAASPYDHTFVITHCNGGAGYVCPAKLFPEGGYEVDSTRFAPAAADLLVQRVGEMLQQLKQ